MKDRWELTRTERSSAVTDKVQTWSWGRCRSKKTDSYWIMPGHRQLQTERRDIVVNHTQLCRIPRCKLPSPHQHEKHLFFFLNFAPFTGSQHSYNITHFCFVVQPRGGRLHLRERFFSFLGWLDYQVFSRSVISTMSAGNQESAGQERPVRTNGTAWRQDGASDPPGPCGHNITAAAGVPKTTPEAHYNLLFPWSSCQLSFSQPSSQKVQHFQRHGNDIFSELVVLSIYLSNYFAN